MTIECGMYELVVDLRGEVVCAGPGVARLCRVPIEEMSGRPITSFLRGPGMTAPYGRPASVSIRAQGASNLPGVALRELSGERIHITLMPAVEGVLTPTTRPDKPRLRVIERLVDETVRSVQNPLTGIVGFAALSQLAPTPHRRRYYLDQVATQAERVRRLVQSLDAGVRPLIAFPVAFDVAEQVTRAVTITRLELEGHGISVELQLPREPSWVEADPKIVGDALICFIHRGTLGLRSEFCAREVILRVAPRQQQRVTVELELTGCDVINDVLPARFLADEGRRRNAMTLSDIEHDAVCDALREQGATLEVAVTPDGEAVTIAISLPAAEAPARVDQTRTPVPLDILTVDDDAMMGELYAELLGVSGHTVTASRSLHSAREALRTHRFDAVIADFYLQDGTFAEFWADAALEYPGLDSRLIVVTGDRTKPQVREWLNQRKATPVVPKPFTSQSLIHQLALITG